MLSKTTRNEVLVFGALILLGVMARMSFQHIPNFAPVAAVALFAGFFFRSRLLAMAAPLAIMLVSDWFIGGYSPVVMLTVYTMLTMPVLLRPLVRRYCEFQPTSRGQLARTLAFLTSSAFGSSLAFFLMTNFAVWLTWYPATWTGFTECFAYALPFFRFTLLGDFTFAILLFSSYAFALRLGMATNESEVTSAKTVAEG